MSLEVAMSSNTADLSLSQHDIQMLLDFHAKHFPNQSPPAIHAAVNSGLNDGRDDDLGSYADGVKRTLTDEQIKMFRHSEVHRLLSQRKQRRRQEEERNSLQDSRRPEGLRKRKFEDDNLPQQDLVETLVYDEEVTVSAAEPGNGTKVFLWPKLGS